MCNAIQRERDRERDRKRKRRQESVGSVAANPDSLENSKEEAGEAHARASGFK